MPLGDTWHISRLVVLDLRYEWILSLCMILALGAVFSPLFILLGLREGLVGSMLDKLRHDPEIRLVTPKYPMSHPLSEQWLRELRVVADIVVAARTSGLMLDVEQIPTPVNAVPVISEEPVLTQNQIVLPSDEMAVVLSRRLAADTSSKVGDDFVIELIRDTGEQERHRVSLPVIGIVPGSAFGEQKLWLPLALFNEIDRWRDGQGLPAFGLPGAPSGITAEYDGVIALVDDSPADPMLRRMLARRMAFSQPPTLVEILPRQTEDTREQLLWETVGNRISEYEISELADWYAEEGFAAELVPFIHPFSIDLRIGTRTTCVRPVILPQDPICTLRQQSNVTLSCVAVSAVMDGPSGKDAMIAFMSGAGETIEVPVQLIHTPDLHAGRIAIPRGLAGRLNAARQRDARYDAPTDQFHAIASGTRFFRAYASSIDSLEELVAFIIKQGKDTGEPALIEPASRIKDVRQVQWVADSLNQLYLLIAAVSGVSGLFAVVANVYAGIQRNRVDLAYLQLLGLPRIVLILYPLLKSVFLVFGAILVALLAFWLFDESASRVVANIYRVNATLTRLDLGAAGLLTAVILVSATISSLLAAIAVLRIEPGDYIRE
ncbi:ABC transporter permease [Thiohalocapsa sp. ML1]|jgi:putative ABC transport system permease protein|uniref:ABC transporter permease n=1 Tax=Thiohalocapsa sp. ML1 TaxID=1431688 RepID=UPI000732279C|nr:ABC transporter permease [Thiohalocapsa sp. ML1]